MHRTSSPSTGSLMSSPARGWAGFLVWHRCTGASTLRCCSSYAIRALLLPIQTWKAPGSSARRTTIRPPSMSASCWNVCELLDRAGIDVNLTLPWNAYPWYVNRPSSVAELRTGVEPLRRLLGLLPRLQVVLLLGTHAQLSWNLLLQAHPGAGSDLRVLSSRHPGDRRSSAPPGSVRSGGRTRRSSSRRRLACCTTESGPTGQRHLILNGPS